MSATAGDPGASAQGPGAENGATQPSWTAALPDDVRGYVENKGWKGPADAVSGYRNLEKFHGVPPERLIKLPDKDDAPEWGEIHGKLGRPAKPEEYGIEGAPADLLADIHEAGLTKRQAQKLAAKLTERAQAQSTAAEQQSQVDLDRQEAELRREWGPQYEPNLRKAREVAAKVHQAVGFKSTEDMNAFLDSMQKTAGENGYLKVMKLFAYFGRNLGEDGFVDGASGANATPFGMTPAAAQSKADQMKNDPDFLKRYHSEVKEVRMAAAAEMQELLNIAHPDDRMQPTRY